MTKECKKCRDAFPHIEHQRCIVCHEKVPIPLNVKIISNTTICDNCDSVYWSDEDEAS